MARGSYIPKSSTDSDSPEDSAAFSHEQLALFPLPEKLPSPEEKSDEDEDFSDLAGSGNFIDILEEV